MNQLEQMFHRSSSPAEYARKYLDYLSSVIKGLDVSAIAAVTEKLDAVRRQKKTIFVVGNGGSAATAHHFVNDFGIGCLMEDHQPFRILSLSENMANVTALGNDTSYDNIFVGQMKSLFRSGDVLLALSVSGNSPNIIKAVEYARLVGGFVIGLTGFDGGKLKSLADLSIHARTGKGEYGPVEDIHLILDHLISSFLKQRIFDSPAEKAVE
jgi:D-sedoheptulose 7-phosphate isomerase